jgi:hypothetical protein
MQDSRGARGHRRGVPDAVGARCLTVISLLVALLVAAGTAGPAPAAAAARARAAGHGNPLAGRAMWIWELGVTDGGDVAQIASDAHRYGVGTVMIKSSDGSAMWPQFSASLVATLHAAGLRVCAWQYVYGNRPIAEAYRGADAVRDGADCLLIDAETEYEGKYVSAQAYLGRLRALIGPRFPVALAGFPYVDYHPAFPYSVFLGPGGAQYNAPQMYWRDIGVTTDEVFAHTYSYNLVYGRPIYPLGQLYGNPPAHQVLRFRQLSRVYGAPGLSWWDWQEAQDPQWSAVSRPVGPLAGYTPTETMPDIGQTASGDLVVWAQEHLDTAGFPIAVTGEFGWHTLAEVQAFQTAHGLTADGVIGPETWAVLLRYAPAKVTWSLRGGQHATLTPAQAARERTATATSSPAAVGPPAITAAVPASAHDRARRDEIAGAGGAGSPPAG